MVKPTVASKVLVVAVLIAVASVEALAQRTTRFVVVDTHINPSAGEITVMTRDSQLVAKLPGWTLRILPDETILYHRNAVHFAPTHWAELWTWNPDTRRDSRLYPSGPTKRADSRLGDTVIVAPSGRTVAFMFTYGSGGGRSPTPPREVAVVCRGVGTARSHCEEHTATSLAKAHPRWTQTQILDSLVATSR